MLTENTKNVQVAPTTRLGKATEVVNCAMKKMNHTLYCAEVFQKAEKVVKAKNFFIKVITSTLLLKLNFLFQILICKVNNLDLKQHFFQLNMLTCIYATWKVIYRNLLLSPPFKTKS